MFAAMKSTMVTVVWLYSGTVIPNTHLVIASAPGSTPWPGR